MEQGVPESQGKTRGKAESKSDLLTMSVASGAGKRILLLGRPLRASVTLGVGDTIGW